MENGIQLLFKLFNQIPQEVGMQVLDGLLNTRADSPLGNYLVGEFSSLVNGLSASTIVPPYQGGAGDIPIREPDPEDIRLITRIMQMEKEKPGDIPIRETTIDDTRSITSIFEREKEEPGDIPIREPSQEDYIYKSQGEGEKWVNITKEGMKPRYKLGEYEIQKETGLEPWTVYKGDEYIGQGQKLSDAKALVPQPKGEGEARSPKGDKIETLIKRFYEDKADFSLQSKNVAEQYFGKREDINMVDVGKGSVIIYPWSKEKIVEPVIKEVKKIFSDYKDKPVDAEYHRRLGRALKYSEQDINDFLSQPKGEE